MERRFTDRQEAGRMLAGALAGYARRDNAIVLALPRGGVPVAHEISKALGLPLDLWLVRKLGLPGRDEFAMGAVAVGDVLYLDKEVIRDFNVPDATVQKTVAREIGELARRSLCYRGSHQSPHVRGKTVIVVDDGLATGSTMQAAILSLRQAKAGEIVVAVPVAPPSTIENLRDTADDVVCLMTPCNFRGVGDWYGDFTQTGDDEVKSLLELHAPAPHASAPSRIVSAVMRHALPLEKEDRDLGPLLNAAMDKKYVLIGEASHGTEEFYRTRAAITRHLINEAGFDAVTAEADWPDAWRVNEYVCHRGGAESASGALSAFERFPTWMWRNNAVQEFAEYLHTRNTGPREPVGFYGLDLYSLGSSAAAVIAYLEKADPAAAARARERYACFDQFLDDPQGYGYATTFGIAPSCEQEIVAQLVEMQQHALASIVGGDAAEAHFCARQNAKLVYNAEQYYRSLFFGHAHSWNLRDRHMFGVLEDLSRHLELKLHRPPRIVVWAHNSHLGNAAATEMGSRGEINLGQLVREKYGRESLLVGFSTSRGTVMAASEWDGPAERKPINAPLEGSCENVFGQAGLGRFMLDLREENEAVSLLREKRLQRAIGVIYRPDTERHSHYFYTSLPAQFDFLLHFDETTALSPLESQAHWRPGEMDETFPYGL